MQALNNNKEGFQGIFKIMRKRKKTIQDDGNDRCFYPHGMLNRRFLSEQDEAFCLLKWCGFPAAKAYRIVYNTSASVNSAASMACRKLQEPNVARYLQLLRNNINFLKFN